MLEDASFTVMPREKVGLVGRNGAGKTSLLRTLGGELPAAGGTVTTKGGFGYLPQDPRLAGVMDGRNALTHILSGTWRRRGARADREVAHRDGGGGERSQRAPVLQGGRRVPAPRVATPRAARRARSPPGSGSAPIGWSFPCATCRAASDAVSSCRGSCSPDRMVCCSTSRRTTSTSMPKRG